MVQMVHIYFGVFKVMDHLTWMMYLKNYIVNHTQPFFVSLIFVFIINAAKKGF